MKKEFKNYYLKEFEFLGSKIYLQGDKLVSDDGTIAGSSLLLDDIVSPLVRQGQSPYMILQNHPEIKLSEKTIYNYIESGALSVKNIDLPKKVKYKVRNVHTTEITDSSVYEGRTYKDFQNFLKEIGFILKILFQTSLKSL